MRIREKKLMNSNYYFLCRNDHLSDHTKSLNVDKILSEHLRDIDERSHYPIKNFGFRLRRFPSKHYDNTMARVFDFISTSYQLFSTSVFILISPDMIKRILPSHLQLYKYVTIVFVTKNIVLPHTEAPPCGLVTSLMSTLQPLLTF